MEQIQYRVKAKIVAIVDLILIILSIWLPVFILIAAVGVTVVRIEHPEFIFRAVVHSFAAYLWILFSIVMIVLIIQLVAVAKLLNATSEGKQPAEAAKLAGFWQILTIVFTIVGIFGGIVTLIDVEIATSGIYLHLFCWGSIVLRCIGIYVVHQFVSELQVASATSKSNDILLGHHCQVSMTIAIPVNTLPLHHGQDNPPPSYNDVMAKAKG